MAIHKKLNPKQLIKINEAIRENGIIVDGMLQADAYRKYHEFFKSDPDKIKSIAESLNNRMADYTLVDEKFFNHNAEMWVFENTVLIINWQEEVAVEINNPDIMNFMKDMYEVVKESGRKVDHNQAMREILGVK